MPFQISLLCSSKSRGIINWFTAGVDQYATCAPEITLTAVVDGNLGGHTIWWEQIVGDSQIVWLTPQNQLQVTFAIVGGSADRTFRFYIDKGTPMEQYDDVVTWGTPTDLETVNCGLNTVMVAGHQACRDVSCGSVSVWYAFPLPSDVGSIEFNPTTGFEIKWSTPTCDTEFLQYTTVSHNATGTPMTIGVVTPLDYPSVPIPNAYGIYYLSSTYSYGSDVVDTYTIQSCRYQQQQPDNAHTGYATDTMDIFNFGSHPSSVFTYYTLLPFITAIDDEPGFHVQSHAYELALYTLITVPKAETISETSIANSILNTHGVTYYSNNGIGG